MILPHHSHPTNGPLNVNAAVTRTNMRKVASNARRVLFCIRAFSALVLRHELLVHISKYSA